MTDSSHLFLTIGTKGMRDTTITTRGSYVYNHQKLLLTIEVGNKEIEAWITPPNRISFQDSGDFFEFKRK